MIKLNNTYFRILFNALLIIFFWIFQIAFVNTMPYPFNNINLIIVVLIFALFIFDIKGVLLWSAGLGWLMDLYDFTPMGLNLISLVIAVGIVCLLRDNFFTNRSLYAMLALTFVMFLIFEINIYIINYFLAVFTHQELALVFNGYFFINKLYGLMLSETLVVFCFYLLNFLSKSYKPFLLNKKSS